MKTPQRRHSVSVTWISMDLNFEILHLPQSINSDKKADYAVITRKLLVEKNNSLL